MHPLVYGVNHGVVALHSAWDGIKTKIYEGDRIGIEVIPGAFSAYETIAKQDLPGKTRREKAWQTALELYRPPKENLEGAKQAALFWYGLQARLQKAGAQVFPIDTIERYQHDYPLKVNPSRVPLREEDISGLLYLGPHYDEFVSEQIGEQKLDVVVVGAWHMPGVARRVKGIQWTPWSGRFPHLHSDDQKVQQYVDAEYEKHKYKFKPYELK